MVNPPPAIRCQGLARRYGNVEALKPLNLTVPTGSVFGFLGRNGAGKTTTIRLLTGLARPTAGVAWVAGVRTTGDDHAARETFGHLPEEPAFYGWMTPREFLDYVGRLFGLAPDERRRRVDELLEMSGLEQVAKRRIAGFSRGMRQRLGLAQALIHRPPVLFLDEPTSALDPAGRRDVLDLIERLRGEATVFLSSHILDDVERVCDTIGIIRQGELLFVEGRDELLARHVVNTAVLELVPNGSTFPEPFQQQLAAQEWVASLTVSENTLRLTAGDVDHARQALLPLVVEHGLLLNRYEWVRPTLEEIFLNLSA